MKKTCLEIRQTVFKVAYKAKGAHLGGCFSCVEILSAIYFGDIMNINHDNPADENRDRFILSKGHSALTLYTVLNKKGFISKEDLYFYCSDGAKLGTHPKITDLKNSGVESTTGSLGHGLSFSIGLALAAKMKKKDFNVYCLIGDGECQEGSIWEAALFAPHHQLNNLTVIVDYNKLQAMDRLEKIITMEPFADKWKSFGWDVYNIDGHNTEEIIGALKIVADKKPKLIIANTVKGKGVSCMENAPLWHFRFPAGSELDVFLDELHLTKEELIQ